MSEQAPDQHLPQLVEPRKLATAQASFERSIALDQLVRLQELALRVLSAKVSLHFDRDEQNRPELRGLIQAQLELECQRCLEPMLFDIERSVQLAIVWDEAQAKALPKGLDPWVVGEGEADLVDIIEEEILLDIPVVARHEHDCLNPDFLSIGEGGDEAGETKANPFSVLADLKGKH
ncbi:YceD family protein [Agaribacterium haliotis]|uniref:YceD family protein n=1 Tax=Agaribacterium haliotis TaxID=2013869 RepID=UPI000BB558EB|nr:YceD family protein [Agaribacterium haliotis]